ncbi:hypothetical protein AGDE_16436 [Angomonas deanei]|uniref:Adenosine/AMP deaminase n=1 Tax=Angomonas deanei TaxID=59799 RepID=A0A7G2CSZ7_9TRYP|nr:hypothetical protein AGDE_16436 [Angomonas deanei]CAD2222625.1 hypothetical protein, conserved [Angomonas deanei]|eukprot:EPY17084.1 hypothetical protein AGDE_16436 [Angomonas deanei]
MHNNIDNRSNEEIVKEVYQTKIISFLQQHMHVRLLLSVNRAHPIEESREAIVLAKEVQSAQIQKYKNENTNHHQLLKSICWLVGIDLSGNCYKGDLDALLTLFQTELQGVSLPVTMHAGEKQDETELQHMYDYAPPRYGHLVFTDDRLLTAILTKPVRENEKIPNVEICITSNLLTSGHESVRQHHLCTIWKLFCDVLYKKNENRDETMFDVFVKHPQKCLDDSLLLRTETWKNLQDDYLSEHHQHDRLVLPNIALHTDDRGVFETSMTDELALFLQHPSVLHLNENENKELLFYRVCAFVYVLNVLSLANAFSVSSDIIQKNNNSDNFQLQYLMDQFYAV